MKVDSSSGRSSASPRRRRPCSSSDVQQRKRRRMQSNRESARRSRMRKQKHLEDLTAEVAQLSKENKQIWSSINATTQHSVKIEAQNSVLRAQMMELSQRLHSLNQIAAAAAGSCVFEDSSSILVGPTHHHPIMAAAHIFDYY